MGAWILAGFVVVFAILVIRHRRGNRPNRVAEELFEGLLPSAATGYPDREPENDGWGLRWADAVHVTPERPAASRRSEAAVETAADAVETTPESAPRP